MTRENDSELYTLEYEEGDACVIRGPGLPQGGYWVASCVYGEMMIPVFTRVYEAGLKSKDK